MRSLSLRHAIVLAMFLAGVAAAAPPLTRAQALAALEQPQAERRLEAVARLAELGQGADADRLLGRLADDDAQVREQAAAAVWQVWSRSGDAAVDRLFGRGVAQMQSGALPQALATFSEIVRRKPAFAEGWNKRATVLFLLGENEKSLKDCDEVFKRNPRHFGALSGAGQIHLQLGHHEQALHFFRRALAVNPNLDGLADAIPVLEQRLRAKGQLTT
jgi:tetratricopeptide (TPR) repeat protein